MEPESGLMRNWNQHQFRTVSRGFTDGKRLEIALRALIPEGIDAELESASIPDGIQRIYRRETAGNRSACN